MNGRRTMLQFLIFIISLGITGSAVAATRYVWTNSPGPNNTNYLTWETAATNIQDAVNSATNGDLVWVTNGIYYAGGWTNSGSYTAMVVVVKGITVQSVNGPEATIVDGNYPAFTNRCFYINNANAVVSGFTITNGHAEAASPNSYGGGVLIKTAGLLTNCIITGNSVTGAQYASAEGGGGVYLESGGVVKNCTISGNATTKRGCGILCYYGGWVQDSLISNNINNGNDGGGVNIYAFGAGMLSNCVITGNRAVAGLGGGLLLSAGTAMNCTVSMNYSSLGGGGVYVDGANSVLVSNCSVYYNSTAARGGGVQLIRGRVLNCSVFSNYAQARGGGVDIAGTVNLTNILLQNCAISSNKAPSGGGGLHFYGSGTARNCLISDNSTSGGDGGGIDFQTIGGYTGLVVNCTIVSNASSFNGGGVAGTEKISAGTYWIVNSIIYSNAAPTGPNWYTNDPGYSFSNCCTTPTNDLSGTANISTEPVFVDFANRDFRLTPNSPCINAGINQAWMLGARDLDGRARIYQAIVDIGAYEFLPSGIIFTAY